MGTISYWKPNHLLIGALELKFQVLSQHPQKFLTGRGGVGGVAEAVLSLYLHCIS